MPSSSPGSDVRDPLASPARHETLARAGLEGAALDRALDLAVEGPDRAAWARIVDRTLLVAGAALVLAAVLCFFAYNWHALPRLAKLGLVASGVAAATVAALPLGLDRLAGKVALSAAAVLAGVLLAVFGQVYQTGADAWQLFAIWAAVLVPWALAAAFPPLWAIWFAVGGVALVLYGETERLVVADVASLAAAFFGAGWLAWERFAARFQALAGRAMPRLLAVATLGAALVPAVGFALEPSREDALGPPALVLLAGFWLWHHVARRRDLLVVTAALASLVALASSAAGHLLVDGLDELGVLLTGGFVVAAVALALRWLTHLHRTEAA